MADIYRVHRFVGFAIFFAVKVELLKKKTQPKKTYAEIVAFVKNDPVDREQMTWSKKCPILAIAAKLLLGTAFALVALAIAFFVRVVIFNYPSRHKSMTMGAVQRDEEMRMTRGRG